MGSCTSTQAAHAAASHRTKPQDRAERPADWPLHADRIVVNLHHRFPTLPEELLVKALTETEFHGGRATTKLASIAAMRRPTLLVLDANEPAVDELAAKNAKTDPAAKVDSPIKTTTGNVEDEFLRQESRLSNAIDETLGEFVRQGSRLSYQGRPDCTRRETTASTTPSTVATSPCEGMVANPQGLECKPSRQASRQASAERLLSFRVKRKARHGAMLRSSSQLACVEGAVDLNTAKAQARIGRPAVLGRFHIAPARRFEDDYELKQDVLGEGYSGAVQLGSCINTGTLVAVKTLQIYPLDRQEVVDCASEAGLFLALDHPHIVRLADAYLSQHRVDLVMERMEGGELFDRAALRRKFSEAEAAELVEQVLSAISYLHSCGIAHCDVKLENVLFEKPDSNRLKLADFGFSQLFGDGQELTRNVGTTSYIAPNVLEGNYRSDCDLWSVGVLAFALLTGRMPFAGPERQRERDILEGRWDASPALWSGCSADALDFVQSLLVVESSARLTAPQALAHKWMSSHRPKRIASIDGPIIESLRTFAGASHFRRACWSVMAWSLSAEERETIRDAFLAMDVSKSGTIHLWEMRQVLMERGVSAQESSFFFETLNMERNTELGYSDFLAAMCASRITLKEHHVKETFRRFDCDNSGRISYDNLHDVFCTPLDDPEVNDYFTGLAGDDGLDEAGLETVLRANGHFLKEAYEVVGI